MLDFCGLTRVRHPCPGEDWVFSTPYCQILLQVWKTGPESPAQPVLSDGAGSPGLDLLHGGSAGNLQRHLLSKARVGPKMLFKLRFSLFPIQLFFVGIICINIQNNCPYFCVSERVWSSIRVKGSAFLLRRSLRKEWKIWVSSTWQMFISLDMQLKNSI